MSSYNVEYAKSGRSSCKKCKEKIPKDEMRIGANSDTGEYTMTSWYHPKCFNVPRKLKVSAEEFVENHLDDATEDNSILPDKAEEIIAAMASKAAAAKKAGSTGNSFIDRLKKECDEIEKKRKAGDDSGGDEPASKKAKSDDDSDKHQLALELYGKYHKTKAEELKDMLRWNRQALKGTKNVVLHKVIDGEMNGRLARCSGICQGGKLKINDDCTKIVCSGGFDEESQQRIPCDGEYTFENAPRVKPWFTEAPTEEQKEEMDRLEAIAKGEEPDGAEDEDSDLGKLMKAAEGLELDMSKMKKATVKIVDLLEESEAQLDVPDAEKDFKIAVHNILAANKEASPPELVKLCVKKFGFVAAKEEKKAKKDKDIEEKCQCPENAPVVSAMMELAELYFKEKNTNAGGTYNKVAKALKELEFVVTAKNAMSLGKAGKTKVDGIGASSAKKIKEFMTTGTMEKLEEKRANQA